MARRAARPGLGLAIFAVLLADVFLATHWNHSTPVTLSQSVEAFRASQASSAPSPAETAPVAAFPPPPPAPPPSTLPPRPPQFPAPTMPPRATASPARAT